KVVALQYFNLILQLEIYWHSKIREKRAGIFYPCLLIPSKPTITTSASLLGIGHFGTEAYAQLHVKFESFLVKRGMHRNQVTS
ncbi:hypothetical protein ACJX0J_005580, partial [Zea mays]